ncbi:hypothetical protein CDAR_183651 [Caerostris darwini]|uniref:Uncharacterized protein n=1 Tax=Caerostris darwini TaxID=1538125 RepID=A0AAV4TR64_9ARAC|nr:hypothetical protein CDAR_183651 [Caerostris darwini]
MHTDTAKVHSALTRINIYGCDREAHENSRGKVKQMSGKTKFRCNKDSIFQFTERETDSDGWEISGETERELRPVTACPVKFQKLNSWSDQFSRAVSGFWNDVIDGKSFSRVLEKK